MEQRTSNGAPKNSDLEDSDRTWPAPSRPHAMRMSWHDLLFAHWSFEPRQIDALLPNGVIADTFAGRAWVAVVPFRMTDVAPRFVPELPWLSRFPELNIRTYVSLQGKPGVWFFSLDATNRIAVRLARLAFHLPYMDAEMDCVQAATWYNYRSHRTHRGAQPATFVGKYRAIGDPFFAQPGTIEYWLTARYCLYTKDRKENLLRGEIDHPPWPLQRAELVVEKNTMLDSLGLVSDEKPHLLFAKEIAVRAWLNERV